MVALSDDAGPDLRGEPLRAGDRVTWTEYFHAGPSYHADVLDLPQKAAGLQKYGHAPVEHAPHLLGGFADHCYVMPGTGVLRIPDALTDEEAAPLNCGVATMAAVTEAARIGVGATVVVQGLGLLGLYGAAFAKARGARHVIGIDPVPQRRALAARFGVDRALDSAQPAADLIDEVHAACRPDGADAVLEVCGDPTALATGTRMLRAGGTYAIAGLVTPGATATLDFNLVLRRCLHLRGVHNYHPRHLVQALDFVASQRGRFPFSTLVDARYPLDAIDRAMADAVARRVLRAAVVP